ncbi:MAG: FAD-dependent oxidoreductase [Deltaproteobacteria bacterium]|nr:FAD-dependent oxidoreductase [Deltaproteobacteria bacterium]
MASYDILIVGAGPAGGSAALYAARAGWHTLVVDAGIAGGSTGSMPVARDYPGCSNEISGATLVEQIRRQAVEAGAELRETSITSAAMGATAKQVFSRDGAKFEGRAVILSTGGMQRPGALPGERERVGRGVSYSVVRDAPLFRGQRAVVYGKSTEAVQATLALLRYGAKVTMVIPSSKLDAPEPLQEELRKKPDTPLLFSTSIKHINGDSIVTGVVILSGGQEKEVPTEGIFLYHHGHKIDTQYLAGTVDCSPDGTVLVGPQLETSIPGVFAAGDILTGEPQLPVICAAQGVMAALGADKYLRNATQ